MMKRRRIFIGLAVLMSLFVVIIFYFTNTPKVQEISFSDRKAILEKYEDSYIIYGSEYCLYCNEMEPVYKDIVKKERIKHVYYVNLANEEDSVTNQLKNEKIDSIPVIIKYHYDKPIKTLSGNKKSKILENFFR